MKNEKINNEALIKAGIFTNLIPAIKMRKIITIHKDGAKPFCTSPSSAKKSLVFRNKYPIKSIIFTRGAMLKKVKRFMIEKNKYGNKISISTGVARIVAIEN